MCYFDVWWGLYALAGGLFLHESWVFHGIHGAMPWKVNCTLYLKVSHLSIFSSDFQIPYLCSTYHSDIETLRQVGMAYTEMAAYKSYTITHLPRKTTVTATISLSQQPTARAARQRARDFLDMHGRLGFLDRVIANEPDWLRASKIEN